MSNLICNFVILGKTGVGKSSLLNYLTEEKIADTGTGKPVTGEGVYDYKATIDGNEVRIFDSWGIEADKLERWKKLLEKHLSNHGIETDVKNWFHVCVYCISAGSHRVEPIDTEIIAKFLTEGYFTIVALTKADSLMPEQTDDFMEKIISAIEEKHQGAKSKIKIIPVCAEKKVLRGGRVTESKGRTELADEILARFKDTVVERLPKRIVFLAKEKIDEWSKNIKHRVKTSADSLNATEWDKKVESESTFFFKELIEIKVAEILKKEYQSCGDIFERLTNIVKNKSQKNPFTHEVDFAKKCWIWAKRILSLGLAWLFAGKDQDVERLCEEIDNAVSKMKLKINEMEKEIRDEIKENVERKFLC